MEDLKTIKQKYKLKDERSETIFREIKNEFTNGLTSVENPFVNIIIGQPGSGKSTFSKKIVNSEGNILRIDGDKIRQFHPLINKLKKEFPENYCFIIEPDCGMWKRELFMCGVLSKYNISLEISTKDIDKLLDFIFILKKNNYDIILKAIAVNKLESMISIFERYYNQFEKTGVGRIGDYSYHTKSYENILYILSKIEALNVCRTQVYTRDGECVYDSENEIIKGLYLNAFIAMQSERAKGLPTTMKSFKERYNMISSKKTNIPKMQNKIERQLKELLDEYTKMNEQLARW